MRKDMQKNRPKIGLALSGSGNRSAFYIGFLEELENAGIRPDYITACSGGSIVVAAFAAGNLMQLKKDFLSMTKQDLVKLITSKRGKGGIFSLDPVEEELRRYTNGLTFENSQILMSFIAADLESGQIVELAMGDVARAARISCTMPGVFEPVKWGNQTLVDGGLLCIVPLEALKKFPADITIGIDMRTTPNIFTATHINIKRFANWVKKMFFIDELKGIFNSGQNSNGVKFGTFSILGRSLDLVIEAKKQQLKEDRVCDLMIEPDFPILGKTDISENAMQYYYEMGVKTAQEQLPKIRSLINSKVLVANEV